VSDDATPKNPTEPEQSPKPAESSETEPQPVAATEASAPPAEGSGAVAATAEAQQATAGGSQTEPTAVQEGAATAEEPLAPLVARQERETSIATAIADSWGRDAWVHPDVEEHPAVRAIRERFPEAIVDIVRFRDETTIHVRAELLREICAYLREHPHVRLDFLSDLTALDMLRLRDTPRFDVVVQLYSLSNRVRLRLKAGVNDGEPVPSLVPLWNGANWWEREVYDMFGIVFDGHPNLRRILLADDWDDGFPLRKDYPLRGWSEFPVYNTERTVPRQRTRWTGRGQ
jgi:NADH-quinone oxidoreductase subunit C